MPTYEYECDKCGLNFERFQNMTEDPIKECPKCKGPVTRLISAGAAVIFKGSGFYATDYRSENYKREAKKEEGLSKTSDIKTSGSSKSDKKSDKSG